MRESEKKLRDTEKDMQADFSMSIEETNCFIGVRLVSGYNKVPKRSMYWEEMDDVKNQLISMNIRRNTFDKIMQYIHVADSENLPQGTKISRVWDYFLELKTNFKKYNLLFLKWMLTNAWLNILGSMELSSNNRYV